MPQANDERPTVLPPAADEQPAAPLAAKEPPDPWTVVKAWLYRHLGWSSLIVFAIAGIWWEWEHVRMLPGIEPVVSWLTEQQLPKANPTKFNVAIARLEGDDNGEMVAQIRESLAEFPSVITLSLDRRIAFHTGNSAVDERMGHERARDLLRQSGADVLLWGIVLKDDKESLPKLYWTLPRSARDAPSAGRYEMAKELRLPVVFWTDLTKVLSLLIVASDAEFARQRGSFQADQLLPFIQNVRDLMNRSDTEEWEGDTRAQVLSVLGRALTEYGDEAGNNDALLEAVGVFLEVLRKYNRERVPLDWAKTQSDLAWALELLGKREGATARLEQAVSASHAALQEFAGERAPLEWARAQLLLGIALESLGDRDRDTARLEQAVGAYREALKQYTRERYPLSWAMIQNNLGNALLLLSERDSGTERLAEAISAYSDALQEYTRDSAPLLWAETKTNLGAALEYLGEREGGAERLELAVSAYREALQEQTRERVPLAWATTQLNLGVALERLGEREKGTARLEQAVSAYREALQEQTRERVPLAWASTQDNLGVALERLGEREKGTARLEQAVSAYQEALQERTRERIPIDWAVTQYNLGIALERLGDREASSARYIGATTAFEGALSEYRTLNLTWELGPIEERLRQVRKKTEELKQKKKTNLAQFEPGRSKSFNYCGSDVRHAFCAWTMQPSFNSPTARRAAEAATRPPLIALAGPSGESIPC